jgi:hypothetical protein
MFFSFGFFGGGDGVGSDQTLSHYTIDEGGLQQVCNHIV